MRAQASETAPRASKRPELQRIGRYRVEGELGRGTMGAVYRARDEVTGRAVAVKRMIGGSARHVAMFEREYHTLQSLRHPRIIEVLDYGRAADGPFYAMELLDGRDLRELAPLPFARACSYLRDVASSLALLHARHLLHRDLSPRNVRVTGDDRVKLFDFGCLTSFGTPDLIAGTPPCIPPEALHHAALDQRADLFALGALAYYVLSGRHAYPARELSELSTVWRTPPLPPSELQRARGLATPPIPVELDALVMALLTLNPLGRPASCAEVIDRLQQIGGLAPDVDGGAPSSYLFGVATVGRERPRERLRKRLHAAIAGHGGSVLLQSESGMGGSRMLTELSVDAQLEGALPLIVDAAVDRGAAGVAHELIAQLLASAPADALASAQLHAALLARFSTALRQALAVAPDETDFSAFPGELRKRTQDALAQWLLTLAGRRALLIAVDNAERMDDGSAALLVTLAAEAASHALLVVACAEPPTSPRAPSVAHMLRSMTAVIALQPLGQGEVHALVRSLFGDVPNAPRLADWMHRLSGGNPRACMQLAAHLVESGAIRYIDGAWVLPQELSVAELPESLDALLAQRLQQLPEHARTIAQALAVHRGALALSSCLALASRLGVPQPHDALARLVGDGVLRASGNHYLFAHDVVRDRMLEAVPAEHRRALHRLLGELLAPEQRGPSDVHALLDAGWHLLHGGDDERGAELLAEAGLQLTFASDEMNAAVPALRAAFEVYERCKRPIHEQLRLLTPLAMASYYSDWRLAELGEHALRLYRKHLGLELAARLRPLLGPKLSMYAALGVTGLRFVLRPALGGVRALRLRIVDYIACSTALTGVAAICLDSASARRRASHLEPFSYLGRDHAGRYAHRFAQLLCVIPQERCAEVIAGCTELLGRFEHERPIRDLAPDARKLMHGGVLYALASMDAMRAESNVLQYADKLEGLGLRLYDMVADQLRALHHALRGEVLLAERFRARVERHAMQAGSAWQAEVWLPCSMIAVCLLTQDALGLKRLMEELHRLARDIPSLDLHARAVRGEYHYLKGDHAAGSAILRPIIEATSDREYIGRTMSLSNEARTLNRLGRYAEAKAIVEPLLAGLSERDREIVAQYAGLTRELAHAEAGLGQHARAAALVAEMIERRAGSHNPLLLGNLHSTAAAVATAAGDLNRALHHLALMEQAFRPTQNPALIAQCEHLRRVLTRLAASSSGAHAELRDSDSPPDESASVRSLLGQCTGADQRAQLALDLLVSRCQGEGGFLFAYQRGELRLIAPRHGVEPQTALVHTVKSDLVQHSRSEDATLVSDQPARSPLPPLIDQQPTRSRYRIYALRLPHASGEQIVGALAIEVSASGFTPPESKLLEAVARALLDSETA